MRWIGERLQHGKRRNRVHHGLAILLHVGVADQQMIATLSHLRNHGHQPLSAVFSVTTLRSVEIAWAAANGERHGLRWLSARELTFQRETWQITVADERGGHTHQLPDLALWPPNSPLPVAIVLERDYQHPRRRRAALKGWQAAIKAGRYAQVRYQTSPILAYDLHRLAAQVGLGPPAFPTSHRRWRARPRKLPSADTWSTSYSESASLSPADDGADDSHG